MNRRDVLAGSLALGTTAVAGCGAFGRSSSGQTPVVVTAVDVLNRRPTPHRFEFLARRAGETAVRRTGRLDGASSSSAPTGVEFADWPDRAGTYTFTLRLDDGEQTLRTTPTELGVHGPGTDCTRVVFVVNLGDRLTAHARTPCTDG